MDVIRFFNMASDTCGFTGGFGNEMFFVGLVLRTCTHGPGDPVPHLFAGFFRNECLCACHLTAVVFIITCSSALFKNAQRLFQHALRFTAVRQSRRTLF